MTVIPFKDSIHADTLDGYEVKIKRVWINQQMSSGVVQVYFLSIDDIKQIYHTIMQEENKNEVD
jgi:hypothetical protein